MEPEYKFRAGDEVKWADGTTSLVNIDEVHWPLRPRPTLVRKATPDERRRVLSTMAKIRYSGATAIAQRLLAVDRWHELRRVDARACKIVLDHLGTLLDIQNEAKLNDSQFANKFQAFERLVYSLEVSEVFTATAKKLEEASYEFRRLESVL